MDLHKHIGYDHALLFQYDQRYTFKFIGKDVGQSYLHFDLPVSPLLE